jgi:hypothetical protein
MTPLAISSDTRRCRMGFASLLIIPFLWFASVPLPDGDGWHVLRVIRGHARAFWISPGMDRDQVRRLLGEDGKGDSCGFVNESGPRFAGRDYLDSGLATEPTGIGVIFEDQQVTRVFSWPVLRVLWSVDTYVLRRVDGLATDPMAEFVDKARAGWKRVLFDIPTAE